MVSQLESGLYLISSRQDEVYVGRHFVEDLSLLPKRILSLPHGVQAPRVSWIVEKLPNGRYRLRAGGAPTGVKDNLVFALLIDIFPAEEWVITHRENHGPNVYTIEKADTSGGWVLPENEPYTQVAARPLIATKSLPPQFPPNELWTFVRIDRD
ncbi:hypothetical protein BD779DRAFT_1626449 [Infundibulicybe gibba]|nr:hypothetical protein BD779DRAFT_1626449 [Infundibulicybe gibba]